jgi:hypothetical protein
MRPVLVSAAALALACVCGTSADAAPAAALRIVERDPLTFRGLHFRAGERVRLVVTLQRTTRVHRLHASAAGTFVMTFADLVWQRRDGNLTVHAIGSRGSHVEFTVLAPHGARSPGA